MPLVLDERASAIMAQKMDEYGVEVHTSTITEEIVREDGGFTIKLKDKPAIRANFIVVGAGVGANIQFLEAAAWSTGARYR